MFMADGAQFAHAEGIFQDAYDILDQNKLLASQVKNSCPSDFDGKADIEEACNLIDTATINVINLSVKIDELRNNLMSLDSAFQESYMKSSSNFLPGDFLGNEFNKNEPFLDFSVDEYYELLYKYLDNKENRTEAEEAAYQELKTAKEESEKMEAFRKARLEAEEQKAREEYEAMSGLEKFWTNTKTTFFSVLEGLGKAGEAIVDGGAMLGGSLISLGFEIAGNDSGARAVEDAVGNFVATDYSGKAYDWVVDKTGLNTYSAYGTCHTVGTVIGQVAGYALLSAIPGGAAVTGTLGALAAGGSAAEQALQSGATFRQAAVVGGVAAVAGAVAGAGVKGVQTAARGAATAGEITKYAVEGALISMAEPAINTTTQYVVYANDGTPTLGEFGEYYVDSGGLQATVMAGAAGGLSTGTAGARSYKEVSDLKTKGFSVEQEKKYRLDLKNNGKNMKDNIEITKARREAYNSWYDECNDYGGWAMDNMEERFGAMDKASITLDNEDFNAQEFWNRKGNKKARVENPTYGSNTMKELEDIKESGEVNVYLTEQQFHDYKETPYFDGTKYDGRVDSDGNTRVYCTKLDSSKVNVKSSKELGDTLGTGWEDGKRVYVGKLDSSSVSYSSGLEASANPDWIPGGSTLDVNSSTGLGVPDLVLKNYDLNPNNYQLIQ